MSTDAGPWKPFPPIDAAFRRYDPNSPERKDAIERLREGLGRLTPSQQAWLARWDADAPARHAAVDALVQEIRADARVRRNGGK